MSRPTVFCLPYAGGSSTAYRGWQDVLPGVSVLPLDYPGRLMRPRDPLLTTSDGLARFLYDEAVRACDGPFALCGASLGALVAFDIARLAEADGADVRAVMVCACAAPDRPLPRRTLADLDDGAFFRAVVDVYGGAARGLLDDPDAQAVVLPALRADITAFESYPRGPREPIAAPVIAVSGQRDGALSYGDVAAWTRFTSGTTKVMSVPGDHFFVEHEHTSLLGELAAVLCGELERDRRGG